MKILIQLESKGSGKAFSFSERDVSLSGPFLQFLKPLKGEETEFFVLNSDMKAAQ
jgi:hypothetical protein